MLHGATIRSSVPRGSIRNITFSGDIPWNEFIIVTAKDIPGKNVVKGFFNDQPFLADKFINHPQEPVALIAHKDKYLLQKARKNVIVDVEPYPAVFTIKDSFERRHIIWGTDNILKKYELNKGDIDNAWANAPYIIEGEYSTPSVDQLYLETNGMIADVDPIGGISVRGSMQCPYFVLNALVPLFNLPPDKIRVIQTETGGAFGGKEEYPSIIAGHAALLAWKSGKTVKLVYDREEDLTATTKRHPSYTKHKTAVSREGEILAMDIEFFLDGGGYATLSPVILSRGTIHATGPYRCANVRIRSYAVATNSPPNGAFRGFGVPQSCFAIERHMDKIAKTLKIDPADIRRINFWEEGQTTVTGQIIKEKVNFGELMDIALDKIHYKKRQVEFSESNRGSRIKKGIGFSCFMHGAAFTGSGEKILASTAGVEVARNGTINILTATTEMGQGLNTVFAQIAADALGIDHSDIEIIKPDTARVPDSGPTVASRSTMIVGDLIYKACKQLKQILIDKQFLRPDSSGDDFKLACTRYIGAYGELKTYRQYELPADIIWDEEKHQGDAYPAFSWAAYAAAVSVDTLTYEVTVDDYVAVQDIGTVINPQLAAGQVEGGVVQGIGFALYENAKQKNGQMDNHSFADYVIPTIMDVPPVTVIFRETPSARTELGCKGVGEMPLDGAAGAVVSAISNAIGHDIDSIPIMPEDLLWKMKPQQ
jgi:CO/xanthine dehydrogenase Mo-binding subunit